MWEKNTKKHQKTRMIPERGPQTGVYLKNIKKTPAAGGENFLIWYLGLGTSRLRYLRYPGAGRGGDKHLST